jgi:hypothetical protein
MFRGLDLRASLGMVGLPTFLGARSIPGEAFCQAAGQALRLPGGVLRQEASTPEALHDLLLRYTQAHINQIAQSAASEIVGRWTPSTRARVSWVISSQRASRCSTGRFTRAIQLPPACTTDLSQATFVHGGLRPIFPKADEARTRSVRTHISTGLCSVSRRCGRRHGVGYPQVRQL